MNSQHTVSIKTKNTSHSTTSWGVWLASNTTCGLSEAVRSTHKQNCTDGDGSRKENNTLVEASQSSLCLIVRDCCSSESIQERGLNKRDLKGLKHQLNHISQSCNHCNNQIIFYGLKNNRIFIEFKISPKQGKLRVNNKWATNRKSLHLDRERQKHMEIVGQHDDSWLVMLIREWVIIIAVWSTYIKLPCWETEKDVKVWQRRERAWAETREDGY